MLSLSKYFVFDFEIVKTAIPLSIWLIFLYIRISFKYFLYYCFQNETMSLKG